MDANQREPTRPPEKLIPLAAVPALPWLPDRAKATHLSTVYRWATVGRRGCKLRTVIAGGRCTTETWLMEFFAALAGEPDPPTGRSPSLRRRASRGAERTLSKAGI